MGSRVVAAALGGVLVVGVTYLVTASRGLPPGDSGELIAAAWVRGVPHPPGYPTFAMLGYLAAQIPIGSVAFRINLLSAVFHALTVGVVILATYRLILRSRQRHEAPNEVVRTAAMAGGLGGGLLLAISPAFWSYALVAEVFALNNFLAALVIWLMVEWAFEPRRVRLLGAAALLSGIAMSNQHTFVLLAPGLFVLYAAGLRALSRLVDMNAIVTVRVVAVPIALALIGMLPYLYLPLAAASDPPVGWGDASTLAGFVDIVTRTAYGTFQLTAGEARGTIPEHLYVFTERLLTTFTPIGVALAGVGVVAMWKAHRAVAVALVLAFAVSGPLFATYANPPLAQPVVRGILERFSILPDVVLAPVLGVGIAVASAWLLGAAPVRVGYIAGTVTGFAGRLLVPALLLAAIAALAIARAPALDRSTDRVADNYAHDILEPLATDALLIMRSDENYTSVVYAQEVEGLRQDVVALDVELLKLPSYVARERRHHPGIELPFATYSDRSPDGLVALISANQSARPVYLLGEFRETPEQHVTTIRRGLSRRVLDADPSHAELVEAAGEYERLNPPDRSWPPSTWQAVIAGNYAEAAFGLALALHEPGQLPEAELVASLYRECIRLSPDFAVAYKNLGLLLRDNGGDPAQVVDAWERYLALAPDDPEAGAIRAFVDQLGGGN